MVVVDASVAGAWVLPDETSLRADAILDRIGRDDDPMAVPALWIYEVSNLLVSAERRKRIDEGQRREALRLINGLPHRVHDHSTPLSRERLLLFATRFKISAYDAAYLELADRLQAPLCTLDERLAAAARELGCGD